MENDEPSLILLDILRGYSSIKYHREKIYIKHFTILEYLSLDEYEKEVFDDAITDGSIETEEQIIKKAITNGVWTEEETKQTKELEWTVKKTIQASKKIQDRNERKVFLSAIKPDEEKLKALKEKRKKITSMSAEVFASEKRFRKLLDNTFYQDEGLTKRVPDKDMKDIRVDGFYKISRLFDKYNIIRASYDHNFFDIFSIQYKNPSSILEKSIYDMTLFQSRLLVFAGTLLNRLHNMQNIPEDITNDAIKLYEYEETENKGENVTEGLDDIKLKMQRKGKITTEDILN